MILPVTRSDTRKAHPMTDALIRRARAFESRHRDLFDALTAGAVTLLAIAGWYAAFALFAD